MSPKPAHLSAARAAAFQDQSVVAAYPLRPPYPAELFDWLRELLGATPHAVLDVGCGTGALARQLVHWAARVDAVDWSAPMLAKGRSLPNGAHPNLRWIHGRAEDAPLNPPYDLITCGEALHWMDWEVVLPRFRAALRPHGFVAIVGRKVLAPRWEAALKQLIPRFSTNPDYQPVDLIGELEQRGLFQKTGERHTGPIPFTQSIADYIESFHSMSSFSRERMSANAVAAFDAELRALVATDDHEQVSLQVEGHIVWGSPV
jgi:SAM-dependent methyltransferase